MLTSAADPAWSILQIAFHLFPVIFSIFEHELSNIPCGYDSEHTQRVLGACPEFAFSPLGGVGEQCLPTAVFAASASSGMMSYELY
jgi:hypothetical protein